jgi:LacI family transcriptional regulator
LSIAGNSGKNNGLKKMNNVPKITLLIDLSATPGRNLMRGIARYARIYGPWQLNHVASDFYDASPQQADILNILKEIMKNSDGIIMLEPDVVDFSRNLDFPIVIASAIRDTKVSTRPTVLTNSRRIGEMGANYFIQKGFKNLAFCGFRKMLWSEHREKYFTATAQKAGLEIYAKRLTYPHREKLKESNLERIGEWIKQLPKPAGIMACNDYCGKLVIDSCRRASISVPDEAAVLGVDNDDIICDLTYPSLSSISLNTEKGGFDAAALLDKIMKGIAVDTQIILIEPVGVQERQSTDIIAVDDKIVSDIISYIKRNSRKLLQVTDIIEEFHISRKYLYKKFTDNLGTSVYDQIRKIKIEEICRMLVETNKSIKEIALEFGFYNVDHIARFFSQVKGITPTQYRNKYFRI